MPLFEYQCRDCGTKFEKLLTSSRAEVLCKSCDSPHVDKLLSVFAVTRGSHSAAASETGPCGACDAPGRGMCGKWQRRR
jgi:putative FmdB family regulatory protein